jgi:hypothetical protein
VGADVIFREDENNAVGVVVKQLFERKETNTYSAGGLAYIDDKGKLALGERIRSRINELPLPDLELRSLGRPDLRVQFVHELYTESQDGPLPPGVSPPLFHVLTSRGCRNTCDFCSSRATKYDVMLPENVDRLFTHLSNFGIKTLVSAEDEVMGRILWLGQRGRECLNRYFEKIRELGLAIEFANGLRPSAFLKKGIAEVDEELIDTVFSHEIKDGKFVGTFRTFIGLERLSVNESTSKLKKMAEWDRQLEVYEAIAKRKIPTLAFGVVLPTEYNNDSPRMFEEIYSKLTDLKKRVLKASSGETNVRLGIFFETPLPGAKNWKYFSSIRPELRDPNLWHFFVAKGPRYGKMWDARMKLLADLDMDNLKSWMERGDYAV